jgi:acyl-CoA thioesterase II
MTQPLAMSLDHALWFYRPFPRRRMAALCAGQSELSGSLGFSRGSTFTRDGILVASVAQEGLLRQRRSRPA